MPARNATLWSAGVSRVWLLHLAAVVLLTGCSGTDVLNRLAPTDTYVRTAGIAYGKLPRQMLDIYRPTLPEPAAGYPVVVFLYGGSWNSGKREDYLFVGEALAEHGILTVVADYRIYPEVRYPDFLLDGAAAVAWTLNHIQAYGGDDKRVFIAGHSAGAYNAAMIAYDPRWLAAQGVTPQQLSGLIGMAGPYNFLPIDVEAVKPVFDWPHTSSDTQPINHVSASAIPTLLLAAQNDNLVSPIRNTQAMAARLQQAGVPVTSILYPRVNHLTLIGALGRPLRGLCPALDDMAAFVHAHPVQQPPTHVMQAVHAGIPG